MFSSRGYVFNKTKFLLQVWYSRTGKVPTSPATDRIRKLAGTQTTVWQDKASARHGIGLRGTSYSTVFFSRTNGTELPLRNCGFLLVINARTHLTRQYFYFVVVWGAGCGLAVSGCILFRAKSDFQFSTMTANAQHPFPIS